MLVWMSWRATLYSRDKMVSVPIVYILLPEVVGLVSDGIHCSWRVFCQSRGTDSYQDVSQQAGPWHDGKQVRVVLRHRKASVRDSYSAPSRCATVTLIRSAHFYLLLSPRCIDTCDVQNISSQFNLSVLMDGGRGSRDWPLVFVISLPRSAATPRHQQRGEACGTKTRISRWRLARLLCWKTATKAFYL